MARVLPRIVERHPRLREQVLRERFRDSVLNELCCDYDSIMSAFELEAQCIKKGTGSSERYRDLEQLTKKLEHELLTRLTAKNH